jgi:hypothetical protein
MVALNRRILVGHVTHHVRAMTGFGYFGVLLKLSARKPGAQNSRA